MEDTQEVQTESWMESLRNAAETDDDQPEEESEEETDEESEEEIEETDESEEEESEEREEVDEDPDVDLGEGKKPVKMSELKSGYLRQSDYTKKTQELATQRKELESEKETLKPVQDWLNHIEGNPWLWQQINTAIDEFNKTGVLPLEDVLQDASSGKYINHLMAENSRLKKELDGVKGEYEGVKLSADMTRLSHALKEEYGDLVTDDYMQQLQERGKSEKLSFETLQEIADGYLAKQSLKSKKDEKTVSRQAEAKALQKLAETKKTAPKPPKSSNAPSAPSDDYSSMSWMDALKAAAKGK